MFAYIVSTIHLTLIIVVYGSINLSALLEMTLCLFEPFVDIHLLCLGFSLISGYIKG